MANAVKDNLTLWIIYLNVVLYATCYQMQRPLELFLVESLVKSKGPDAAAAYGNLQSFFQVFQFFGSLFAGLMLDRLGFKFGFIVNFAASGLCYYLLSISTDMNMLYLSKVPTMFQTGFLVAQMAISVVTAGGEERARALGRLTTAYSVGTVVGPTVGGILGSTGEYRYGAKVAVVGSLLSIALSLLLPSPADIANTPSSSSPPSPSPPATGPTKGKSQGRGDAPSDSAPTSVLQSILAVVSVVWLLMGTKVITSVANSMNATIFPLVMKNTYNFDEKSMGYAMSALSLLNTVVNAVLIGPLVELLGGRLTTVIEVSLGVLVVGAALQGVFSSPFVLAEFVPHTVGGAFQDLLGGGEGGGAGYNTGAVLYLLFSILLSTFQYLMATTITAESTSVVERSKRGTLLGLEHSLFAAARISSPQMGVALMNSSGMEVVSMACAGIYASVFVLWKTFAHTLHARKRTASSDGAGDAEQGDGEDEKKEK